MAKNKFGLQFDGLEDMAKKLDEQAGKLAQAAEKALQAAHSYVTPNLHQEIKRHNRTGKTEASIIEGSNVEWDGLTAINRTGFKISSGGLPSVFLMYGTPKMKPDKALFNAIMGAATRKKVSEIQKDVFMKELE